MQTPTRAVLYFRKRFSALFHIKCDTKASSFRTFNASNGVPQQFIYCRERAFEIQRAVSVVRTQTLFCATVQKASIHGWMHFYMWLWCPIFFCFNSIFHKCHKACHAKRVLNSSLGTTHLHTALRIMRKNTI